MKDKATCLTMLDADSGQDRRRATIADVIIYVIEMFRCLRAYHRRWLAGQPGGLRAVCLPAVICCWRRQWQLRLRLDRSRRHARTSCALAAASGRHTVAGSRHWVLWRGGASDFQGLYTGWRLDLHRHHLCLGGGLGRCWGLRSDRRLRLR